MPHAQPGTLGIPFQQRRGTAANILDPGRRGSPVLRAEATEHQVAILGPAQQGEEAEPGFRL